MASKGKGRTAMNRYNVTAYSAFHGKRITLPITAASEAEARELAKAGGATCLITVKVAK